MKWLALLVILFSFLPIGTQEFQALAQTNGPGNDTERKTTASADETPLRGIMVLRVSERYLEELFARDINKHTPVTRVVLGTQARGLAHTKGRTSVDTKPDLNDAAFDVKIMGSTTSRTVGSNGPAIIHSYAVTNWTCRKTVRFNGRGFVTSPTTIESDTHITPLGADSTLPRLRGRIVARIASRRAVQYNAAAERVVDAQTQKQVQADIDRIIEVRIAKLNQRVGDRSLIAALLPKLADVGAEFSTSSKCINIVFGQGQFEPICPVHKVEPSDTELWIHTSLIAGSTGLSEMIGEAGQWISKRLPGVPIPGADLVGRLGSLPVSFTPVGFEGIDDWIIFRSGSGPATAPAANQQVRVE